MWTAQCSCENPEDPPVFVVVPGPEALNPDRLAVLVHADGTCTNRFDDGSIGVSKELSDLAEDEESAHCPVCMAEAEWVDEGR